MPYLVKKAVRSVFACAVIASVLVGMIKKTTPLRGAVFKR